MSAWSWDGSTLSLRARCPRCDGRLVRTGKRLTCLTMGYRHYHEPVDRLVHQALTRLRTESAAD